MDKTFLLAVGTAVFLLAAGKDGLLKSMGGIRTWMPLNETVSYGKTEETAVNPLIGYAPGAENEERCSQTSLVYVDITWRELEPEEGVYDWEQIEEKNHLDRWRNEGKHAVLRFICDYPGKEPHRDIPDWLYEITKDGRDYDMEYGKGYSPDYANELLIQYHERAVKELGAYFGTDSFVSYVELGSLGHWGEWHVNYEAGLSRMPGSDIRKRYVDPYLEAFPNARLLMRRPFKELPSGAGVYNDMMGHEEDTREWLSWIEEGGEYGQAREKDGLRAVPEIWKTAPVGGEFTSSISMEKMLGEEFETTKRLFMDSHPSFVGPKAPKTEEEKLRKPAEELLTYIGYRYRISRLGLSGPLFSDRITLELSWVNDGVAPIYWDWKPCLYVTEQNTGEVTERYPLELDLRTLLPGETARVKIEIPRSVILKARDGACGIWAGIEDPDRNEPGIVLFMDTERRGNMSLLYGESE